MRNLFIALIIACFTLPLFSADSDAAFGRRKPVYNVTNASFSPSSGDAVELDKVADTIRNAARLRDWEITPVSDGKFEAEILVRNRHWAKVEITFTTNRFSITRLDSRVLMYKREDGKIHRNYNKWIILLEEDIKYQLNGL